MNVLHVIESPIEAVMLGALYRVQRWPDPVRICTQVEVDTQDGRFRLDITVESEAFRVAIECDGRDWHGTSAQKASDARRDAAVSELGWRVARFTGSEIMLDPAWCATSVLDLFLVGNSKPDARPDWVDKYVPPAGPTAEDLRARLKALVDQVNGRAS